MFRAPSLIGAEPWKVEKGNVFSPSMFDVEDCTTKRVFAFGHNLNTKICKQKPPQLQRPWCRDMECQKFL
jgi:hypothetical protein